ncbi:porin family protein [Pontibacter ruber]|uniref:Porin family protein n=1 Tax=Pontibacter ruber TaxID=1343895 RepID=A0ABW5CVW3_9BACT|nr:porin family protein [Pontibacter ruber]
MNKFYPLLAGLLLLCTLYATAQEQINTPLAAKKKYTSIKVGPSFATLSPKGEPWLCPQFGAHAGLYYLTMESDRLGIQAEAQYSFQGAELDRGHLLLHYLNIPITAKFFVAPEVSLQGGGYAGLLLEERYEYEAYNSRPNMEGADYGLVYGLSYGNESKLTVSLRHQVGLADIIGAKNQVVQLSLAYCVSSKQ